jgi:membrane associated rhomboid family serine protease
VAIFMTWTAFDATSAGRLWPLGVFGNILTAKQSTQGADILGERQHRIRSPLPALGVFAGGLAYVLLPTGGFGPHDVAVRAAITGAVAGLAAVLILMLTNRPLTR